MTFLSTVEQGPARQRPWLSQALVAIGVLALGIPLGLLATSKRGIELAVIVPTIALGVIGTRRRWGAAVCLAPVFLFPVTTITDLPSIANLHWRFILAVISALLATSYWRSGAHRPNLNPWTLAAVGFLGIALLALGRRNGISLQESVSLPLFAYTGAVVGQCLRDPIAIRALACLAVPIAILALLEAVGLQSIWATVLHANEYESLAHTNEAARSTASFGHPLIAGACLLATGLLLLSARKRYVTLAGVVCIAAAATTVSRSTLLGGALGIAVFALQAKGRRVRIVAAAAAFAITAFIIISSVPQLKHSFDTRVLNLNNSQLIEKESVREHSLAIFEEEYDVDPDRLLVGGGVGYSIKLLTARGGNIDGFDIFDNEYITMMYDAGFIVVLCVLGLLALAALKSSKLSRRQALPALVAMAVVMAFVDGMEWPSLSVVAWMAIGLFTAPPLRTRGHQRSLTPTPREGTPTRSTSVQPRLHRGVSLGVYD
jgi:hypothetical protein